MSEKKILIFFALLLFETRSWITKARAQRSLSSQISTRRTWKIKHTGLSFQRKRHITCCLPRMLGAGVVNSLVTVTLPVWLRLFHAKSSSRPASWACFSQSINRNYLHGGCDMWSILWKACLWKMSHVLYREFQCSHIWVLVSLFCSSKRFCLFCCTHRIELIITRKISNGLCCA